MPADTIRCHCNNCSRKTDHELIDTRVVDDLEELDENSAFWWTDTYDTLQCLGCRAVSLRHTYEDPTGDKSVSFYPPRVSRRAPTWKWQLPSAIREVLDEIYVALHNDNRRLALMGARTLVDMLMLDEVGDAGTFRDKLTKLHERGVISERGKEVLAVALDAGSAAAHRGYKPDADNLSAVMDVVENALQATYHLKRVALKVKKSTPGRAKSKAAKP